MQNHFFITFLISVLLFSCNEKNKIQENQPPTTAKYSLQRTDSVCTFKLPEFSASNMCAAISFSEGGKQYLCMYQSSTNSLEIYDFEQQKLVKTVSIAREGADGIDGVSNFAVVDTENFIITEEEKKKIVWLNASGKILKKITLPDVISPFAEAGYVISLNNYHNFMQYEPKSNTLWLHAEYLNYLEKNFYKRKLLLRVKNIFEKNMTIEWAGEFPETYPTKGIFAGGHEFSLFQTQQKIGIAFCASNQICLIDKTDNKQYFISGVFPEENTFYPLYKHESEVPADFSLHMKKEFLYRVSAPNFTTTALSPNKKRIFRGFKEKAADRRADGTLTELQEVQHHLFCYDTDMNLLARIPLKKNSTEHYFFVPTNDGVWLYNTSEESEDEISFVFAKLTSQ